MLRFQRASVKQLAINPSSRHEKHPVALCLILACACFLAACGSDFGTPCGAKTQVFGINFEKNAYTGTVGEELKIETKLIPETCRADMTFSIKTGVLTPGMVIVDCNVFGTPTEAGKYEFQIYITSLKITAI
jgi:hypothetical protein